MTCDDVEFCTFYFFTRVTKRGLTRCREFLLEICKRLFTGIQWSIAFCLWVSMYPSCSLSCQQHQRASNIGQEKLTEFLHPPPPSRISPFYCLDHTMS